MNNCCCCCYCWQVDDDSELLGKATNPHMLPGEQTSAAGTASVKTDAGQSSQVSRLLAKIAKRAAVAVDGGTTLKQPSVPKPKRIRTTAAPAAPAAVVASRSAHKPKKKLLSPAEPLPAKTVRAAPTKRIPFTSPASRRDDPRRLLGNYGDVFAVDADSNRDDDGGAAAGAEAVASSCFEATYDPAGGAGSTLPAMPSSTTPVRPLASQVDMIGEDIMRGTNRVFSGRSGAGRGTTGLQRPFSVELMPNSGLQRHVSIELMPSSMATAAVGGGPQDRLEILASAPSLVARGNNNSSSSNVGSGDVAAIQGQPAGADAATAADASAIPSSSYEPSSALAGKIAVSADCPRSTTVSNSAKLLCGTSVTTSAFSADDAFATSLAMPLAGSPRSSGYSTADVSSDSFSSLSWPSPSPVSPSTAAGAATVAEGRGREQELMLSPGNNLDFHQQVVQLVQPAVVCCGVSSKIPASVVPKMYAW